MRIILGFILWLLLLPVFGQETAQWRGPNRNGIYPEKGLLKQWPDGGPKLMLEIQGFGKGYSQPVVYKDVIYITGIKHDTLDVISAYDLTGKLLWEKSYSSAWIKSYSSTRCTPTIQNNRIYLVGGIGTICCLDAKDGKEIWSQDPQTDFSGEYHMWGIAESVLLTDNAALYVTGGAKASVVAYDKINGKLLWSAKSLGGQRAYASSMLIERNNMKIVLAQTCNDLIGINAINGEVLWNYNVEPFHTFPNGKGVNTNDPIYSNGEIFITSGYKHPALMFSLAEDGRSVKLKWQNDSMNVHHGGAILLNGNIYGSNWLNNTKGHWVSVNWETGETNWVKDWFNKGSIACADGMFYYYDDKNGNVALVQPDPNELKIISTFKVQVGDGPYWAHPAIYNGLLYIRHGNNLLIYNIKA
ncbi:MAG: PQQ-binding-like beta-propeller repeat protein [Mariniphaga sp.]